ncbi:AMP-binding protein [Kocuria sp. cx-455]|uniref:AMP-binding protein n=1 Tax=Kocuria sp. cx-455 TaxID=2771377 RepID=UPI003D738D11
MSELPGKPLSAPTSDNVPWDTVAFDGPVTGDPLALLEPLDRALARPGPAVIVSTSGSTGRPKKTVLTTEALTASGRATERATAGPGQWLLCLPAHYVAGVQVLARSVLAGTTPVLMAPGPFTPEGFARAVSEMNHETRYVSVVPTQLQRILDPADGAPHREAVNALARFDAILVGGSALSPALAQRASDAGLTLISTYGMSETCGGCVYNGRPLDTVRIRTVPNDAADDLSHFTSPSSHGPGEGRIWLGGHVVAGGYLDDPRQTGEHFRVIDGQRWYRTDDLGSIDDDGGLSVLGRTDDVINTGGIKVSAGVVTAALTSHPRVRGALVVPVPDAEWGHAVAALVVPRDGEFTNELRRELTDLVREHHGSPAVPKYWRCVAELPLLSTGKPDRLAAAQLFDTADADADAPRPENG